MITYNAGTKHNLKYKVFRQATHSYVQYITCNSLHKTVDIINILFCTACVQLQRWTNIFCTFTKQLHRPLYIYIYFFWVKQNRFLTIIHIKK